MLKSVGAALRSTVRGEDVVARYGGDEFALILPDSSEDRAAPVLDRVRAAIRSMDVPGGTLTACVGPRRADIPPRRWTIWSGARTRRCARPRAAPARDRSAAPPGAAPPRLSRRGPAPRQRAPAALARRRRRHRPGDRARDRSDLGRVQGRGGAAGRARAGGLRRSAPGLRGQARGGRLRRGAAGEQWLVADRGSVGRALGEKRAVLGMTRHRPPRAPTAARPRRAARTPGPPLSRLPSWPCRCSWAAASGARSAAWSRRAPSTRSTSSWSPRSPTTSRRRSAPATCTSS